MKKYAIALTRLIVLVILLLPLTQCTDNDDSLEDQPIPQYFQKDSELYTLLNRVVEPETNDPLEKIVCIDFVYPFEILVYDENLEVVATQNLFNDQQFADLLDNLLPNLSLSITYPIVATLTNGDQFLVDNNEQLKIAIQSCSQDDIVTYCNGAFCTNPTTPEDGCVWTVKYHADQDNKYVGGTFIINPEGHLIFNYDSVDYLGSWAFLFANNELHLNINLEGDSDVANDWHIDQKVYFSDGSIVIDSSPKIRILSKLCQTQTGYQIGGTGPGNGKVFYDKGSYSLGWRYMEVIALPMDNLEWGCSGSLANAQRSSIGSGWINTAAVVNFHDALNNYYGNPGICNAGSNGSVAAKNTISIDMGNQGWFLPSQDELNLIYTQLHLQDLGNFSGPYWSSTEVDATNVRILNFDSGTIQTAPKIPEGSIGTLGVRYF